MRDAFISKSRINAVHGYFYSSGTKSSNIDTKMITC